MANEFYIDLPVTGGGGGSGTVTNVGLTAPSSILSVGGSPVTSSGTLTLSLVAQGANKVWAGPTTGADANPTFRLLVANDLPYPNLTSANILVGNSSNVAAAVSMTGDIGISNTGVTAIQSGVIVNADINASAAIDFSKLAALSSGNILVGSAGNVATSVAMSGDITIIASGATSYNGTVPVTKGGTGLTTLTANNVILGAGTSNVTFVAPGTSGNVLTSNGTTWTSAAAAGGGVTTMAAIGSSANANGATISGSTLNLEPASSSFGGVLTAGTQTIAGRKTFAAEIGAGEGGSTGVVALGSYANGYGVARDSSNRVGFYIGTTVGALQHRFLQTGYQSNCGNQDITWQMMGALSATQYTFTMFPHDSVSTTSGANTLLRAGDCTVNNSPDSVSAGNLTLRAGNSSSTKATVDGGSVTITGGNQTAATGGSAGGNVTITAGASTSGTGGTLRLGSASRATDAAFGFPYVPTCDGMPTGTPTAVTGMAPIVVDATNNKLYFYSGGAWRDAGP